MKRFHVHVSVPDLQASIRFYTALFGSAPSVEKDDYAKWMMTEPAVNFAISQRSAVTGIDHLGFQTDDPAELAMMKDKALAAELGVRDEGLTTCCYARSDKHWITDPQGIAWEHFQTLEDIPVFHEKAAEAAGAAACCSPAPQRGKPLGIPVKAASPCC